MAETWIEELLLSPGADGDGGLTHEFERKAA